MCVRIETTKHNTKQNNPFHVFLFFIYFIGWKYSEGYVNDDMMKTHLYSPGNDTDTLVLMCGPPPMVNYTCIPGLERLGFNADQRFSY